MLGNGSRLGKGFVRGRCAIGQGGVAAVPGVPHLDLVEARQAGGGPRRPGLALAPFDRERGKAALRHGVSKTVPDAAQRGQAARRLEALSEGEGSGWAAVIGMMAQPDGRRAVPAGQGEGIQHQLGAPVGGHGPAAHAPAAGIQHDRQGAPACAGGDLRDGGHPAASRGAELGGGDGPRDPVRRRWRRAVRTRRPHVPPLTVTATPAGCPQQTHPTPPPAAYPGRRQLGREARAPVGATARLMQSRDARRHRPISPEPR
jgi:hypothetical protein